MIKDALYEKLCELKENYNILAIKAEFEAEGSMFRDLVRLRSLTRKADVDLYLKIGGTEAVRDIKDALELDVDGIIVPVIENDFGVRKFFQAFDKIYNGEELFLTANIESKGAVANIEEILLESKGKMHNMTIGRTDLSDSYNKGYKPNDKFIIDKTILLAEKIKKAGFTVTLGGSVDDESVKIIGQNQKLSKLCDKVETRKVVMPIDSITKQEALLHVFEFEKLYILSKKEIQDIFMDAEMKRLIELERRL